MLGLVDGTKELLDSALGGNRRSANELGALLLVIVERRVGYTLARVRPRGRDISEVKRDLTQAVLIRLFDKSWHKLRQWDPARSPFASFIGMITENEVISVLRIASANPWTEDPTVDEDFERMHQITPGPERDADSRERLRQILAALDAKLSDLGHYMFQLLFLDERSVEEVCEITGMTPDAVYQWRTRVRDLVAKLVSEKPR